MMMKLTRMPGAAELLFWPNFSQTLARGIWNVSLFLNVSHDAKPDIKSLNILSEC